MAEANISVTPKGHPGAMDPNADVQSFLYRYDELASVKQPWLIHYQALAEIFLTRKMDFTRVLIPGQFLQDNVFDNSGQFAAYLMASVFLSMMWPDASRTVEIVPVDELKKQAGVEEFFRVVTRKMHRAMDNPRAGLQHALMEHFLDQGIFGTSGPASFEGPEDDPSLPVTYEAWSIKTMCIAENAQGFVDTVYFVRELKVRQIIAMYREKGDRISPTVLEAYHNAKYDDKVEVMYVIEPKIADLTKRGLASMRFKSLHIDKTHKFIMRERGYHEMPVHVGRFFKTMDEPYGRSSGMLALPDGQSLNAISEAVLVASEKQLDPPLAVLDDGRLGGGVIDTSASAINVFDSSGRIGNEKPIFPLFTVGEIQSAQKLQEWLGGKITQAFFLDRLLDLNNQTQMTAYETSVRNKLRGEALGAIFARQEMEVLTPLVERTFNIMFRRGYFGIIEEGIGAKLRRLWAKVTGATDLIVPDAVLQAYKAGLDVFEVRYVSPAKRFMQSEKLQGLFQWVDAIVALQPVMPSIVDNLDPDIIAQVSNELTGAPKSPLRTQQGVADLRAQIAKRQEIQDKMQMMQGAADITQKTAQAHAAISTAGKK